MDPVDRLLMYSRFIYVYDDTGESTKTAGGGARLLVLPLSLSPNSAMSVGPDLLPAYLVPKQTGGWWFNKPPDLTAMCRAESHVHRCYKERGWRLIMLLMG